MKAIFEVLRAAAVFWIANRDDVLDLCAAAKELFRRGESSRTPPDAAEARKEIVRLCLWRPTAFDVMPDDVVQRIINGFGPDAWPQWLRDALDWVFRNFTPLAVIHDVQFYLSDGTRKGFDETLRFWRLNSAILLDDRYPIRNVRQWPARAVAWLKLKASLKALELGSWMVWKRAGRGER